MRLTRRYLPRPLLPSRLPRLCHPLRRLSHRPQLLCPPLFLFLPLLLCQLPRQRIHRASIASPAGLEMSPVRLRSSFFYLPSLCSLFHSICHPTTRFSGLWPILRNTKVETRANNFDHSHGLSFVPHRSMLQPQRLHTMPSWLSC